MDATSGRVPQGPKVDHRRASTCCRRFGQSSGLLLRATEPREPESPATRAAQCSEPCNGSQSADAQTDVVESDAKHVPVGGVAGVAGGAAGRAGQGNISALVKRFLVRERIRHELCCPFPMAPFGSGECTDKPTLFVKTPA